MVAIIAPRALAIRKKVVVSCLGKLKYTNIQFFSATQLFSWMQGVGNNRWRDGPRRPAREGFANIPEKSDEIESRMAAVLEKLQELRGCAATSQPCGKLQRAEWSVRSVRQCGRLWVGGKPYQRQGHHCQAAQNQPVDRLGRLTLFLFNSLFAEHHFGEAVIYSLSHDRDHAMKTFAYVQEARESSQTSGKWTAASCTIPTATSHSMARQKKALYSKRIFGAVLDNIVIQSSVRETQSTEHSSM